MWKQIPPQKSHGSLFASGVSNPAVNKVSSHLLLVLRVMAPPCLWASGMFLNFARKCNYERRRTDLQLVRLDGALSLEMGRQS